MKDDWGRFDKQRGHKTYGFKADILGLRKHWHDWQNRKSKTKATLEKGLEELKAQEDEFSTWFVGKEQSTKPKTL
jgi:fibrillarin-like rRNA methylase